MNKFVIAAVLAAGVMLGYRVGRGRRRIRSCRSLAMTRRKTSLAPRSCRIPTSTTRWSSRWRPNAKPDEIHPTLKTIALYLNTLAHNGVPANHRHIAAVFHQGGGDAVLANDVYKARHDGMDNPNIAMLRELKQAGVDMRVCGQGLLGKKLEPSQVLPGVQVDLWAMTTMVNLQLRGYVRIGG